MKNLLLLVAAVAVLGIAGPAYSQYMFLDVNGDQANSCGSGQDALAPSTTSVDVWLDTNHNGNGSSALCDQTPSDPLTINSYEVILRSTGAVTYGTWTDNMGFTVVLGNANAGGDFYVGRGSGTILPAGKYKLGSLSLSGVAAGAYLSIVASTSASAVASTSFGTSCLGNDFDNTYKLMGTPVGQGDWTDVAGTCPPTPVSKTTWGKIKDLYK